jgi:fibronectin type 3 domain-containing protein
MDRRILAIFFLVSVLITSSFAVPGAFAQASSTHIDEINGPGGLMSLVGPPSPGPIQAPSNPLNIKEHHPAHILKFIGKSVSLSGGDAPASIWTGYGFNKLTTCSQKTTTNDWTDQNLCGHGQTIAIVDAYDDPNIVSDLQTFDTQFGLPACTVDNGCFVKSAPAGITTDSGWALEISLDVEWAHSIAPGAKIVLVESSDNTLGNLLSGENTAVATGARQVSNSWGGSEFSSERTYDSYFNSPTASFFVSSGDGGHGVEWPAASPGVIAVGGTTLNLDSSGNWLSETAWSGSGGGLSKYESKPAYQNNFVSGSSRAVPDVAYDGNPNTGVYVYDSVPINGNSGWWIVGGTSAGAPQWAGISAIANSQGANLASASFGTSSALYGAAAGVPSSNPYTSNYHDITSGSNGHCGSLCNAGPGYDEVTGLGSPQANNIIPYISLPATPTAPSAPQNLQATAGNAQVSLSWTTPSSDGGSAITSYTINRGTSQGGEAFLASVSGSTLSYTDNAVSNGVTYYYTVTATNYAGTSPSSNEVSATPTGPATAPSAPQNLQATAGNAQVSLSWQAPSSDGGSAINNYNIYRSTSTGTETLLTTVGNVLTYTDTGLINGQQYFYKVSAVNGVGEGSQSSEASATPTAPATQLLVAVSTSGSYTANSFVTITVNVTPAFSGATVNVTVVNPNTGATSTGSGTTASNGVVQFQFKIMPHTSSGTFYSVTAQASAPGYISGSGTTSFTTK